MTRQASFAAERCLAIIEMLAAAPDGIALSTIASDLDIPKSAVHRFLQVLDGRGYVRQDETYRYRLTMRLVQMGFKFLAGRGAWEVAQPILDRLAEHSGELVRMTVADGDTLAWLGAAQGAKSGLIIDPVMGSRVVLHATATGKIWLSSLPIDTAVNLVLRRGFGTPKEHGPNVIQSTEALIQELKLTSERGYGLAIEEADPGVAAVAVGITSPNSDQEGFVGTLSVAGPIYRVTRERLEGFVPQLKEAAREIAEMWMIIERGPRSERPRQSLDRVPDRRSAVSVGAG